jgi:hypothetical protein
MRLGGKLGLARDVHVASPFDDATLHRAVTPPVFDPSQKVTVT